MFLFELIERRIKFELSVLGDIILFSKNESPVIESFLFQLGFYIYFCVLLLVYGGLCFIFGRILERLFKLSDRLFDIAHLCIYGEDAIGRET
jgi:hypothetical protein